MAQTWLSSFSKAVAFRGPELNGLRTADNTPVRPYWMFFPKGVLFLWRGKHQVLLGRRDIQLVPRKRGSLNVTRKGVLHHGRLGERHGAEDSEKVSETINVDGENRRQQTIGVRG